MALDLLPTLIPAASALLGAVVAGAISYLAGRGMRTHEWKLALARENLAARRRLYSEFLSEADRLILQSIDRKSSEAVMLKELTAKLSEIYLLSPTAIIDAAKEITDYALLSHAQTRPPDREHGYHKIKEKFVREVRKELSTFEVL